MELPKIKVADFVSAGLAAQAANEHTVSTASSIARNFFML